MAGPRHPPNEDDRLIPQQLLAIKVADNALKDAGIKEGQNIAVIIAMETELALHQFRGRVNLTAQFSDDSTGGSRHISPEQKGHLEDISKKSIHNVAQANQYTSFIGNIMAARISSLWNFSGPAFTVSAEESSVFKALSVARMMLEKGEVEAVLVGAVDLSGGLESVLWRNRKAVINSGPKTLSFDRDVDGWMIGEGAGAVVLKRLDKAEKDKTQAIAVPRALDASDQFRAVRSLLETIPQSWQGTIRKELTELGERDLLDLIVKGRSPSR